MALRLKALVGFLPGGWGFAVVGIDPEFTEYRTVKIVPTLIDFCGDLIRKLSFRISPFSVANLFC
jgi:hypothetical protein